MVFTEQGIAMLSGDLRTERAIAANIEIMRAFVELRHAASNIAAIETRLDKLEQGQGRHDEQLKEIFRALRQLMQHANSGRRLLVQLPPG